MELIDCGPSPGPATRHLLCGDGFTDLRVCQTPEGKVYWCPWCGHQAPFPSPLESVTPNVVVIVG